jgi:propanol-preferring alcohol dehydrogenase
MKAMRLVECVSLSQNNAPLRLSEVPVPEPGASEILIRIQACGVCHTELDEIEGRTAPPRLPVIPGHQAVGTVTVTGPDVKRFRPGERAGVGWIFSSCGACGFCLGGRENLCPEFKATGRDADGGYAGYMAVHEDFAYPIPDAIPTLDAAPLLCAGAIGYRSIRLAELKDGSNLGFSGFGASGHLMLKMTKHLFPGTRIFVLARSGGEREFALSLGAAWAGDFTDEPPDRMDAIIDTTPVWNPVKESLGRLRPGGRLVINAIRKEDADKDALMQLDYPAHLWMEKEIRTVANVTRRDIEEFLKIAAGIPIRPEVREYPLEDANRALMELKFGSVRGAKVLRME